MSLVSRRVVEERMYEYLFEMGNRGFVVINSETNEPQTDYLGKTIVYKDEKSANAAIVKMPPSKRKNYFVDPNFG